MRVCFVNSEIFHYGGYARLNRIVGRELIKRGIEVYVLVPQVSGRRRIEQLDGMVVLGFPYPSLRMLLNPGFFRLPEADIYEIWDPYITFSYFVTRATLKSKHVMVFADPRGRNELKGIIAADPGLRNLRRNINLKLPYFLYYPYLMYLRPYLADRTISQGDAFFCEAKYLFPKVKKMHPRLKAEPVQPVKSSKPTVIFLGRWDAVKRVERFFELARNFPHVRFIATARARDPERDKELRRIGATIPNLEMTDIITEERKREILEETWILANTSVHEGLPQSFIEACTYRCAILSAVNPDGFAENFGYHVRDDDFEAGLEYLLENDRWRECGERAFEYIKETNDVNKVIERRIGVYQSLLA